MGDDSDSGGRSARPAGSPSRARGRQRLEVEIARQGRIWTCLGADAPGDLVRDVATTITANRKLPAPLTTAAVLLAHDARVRALNKAWRGQDKPTNVLSFPAGPAPGRPHRLPQHFLGDVILAEETLAREAAEIGIAPADHFRHLVLHGLLHLLGFDHATDARAEEMEALETLILAGLGVADPYADSTPRQPKRGRAR